MVLLHQFLLLIKTMTEANRRDISTIDQIKTRLSTNLTKEAKHVFSEFQNMYTILIFVHLFSEAFLTFADSRLFADH